MAMAEMDDGELLAAFGDSREEAMEKLEEMFPEDKRLSRLKVQEGTEEELLEEMKRFPVRGEDE